MKPTLLLITMILCASCAKAGDMVDSLTYDTQVNPEYADIMNYTLGSPEADKEFADYIRKAQLGNHSAHNILAIINTGFYLFTDPDSQKDTTHPLVQKVVIAKKYNVKEDYVKSYAHLILAEDFKSGYSDSRKRLAEVMTVSQIQKAEELAEIWKKQIQANNK